MSKKIDFRNGLDWKGNATSQYDVNITGSITSTGAYIPINFGSDINNSLPYEIRVAGNATSPGSFGANPVDKTLFLELIIMERTRVPSAAADSGVRIPIIKWRPSETSTIKDTDGVITIPLSTIQPEGDLWLRISSNSGTFTAADFTVTTLLMTKTNAIDSFAYYNTTNNLYATATTASANSVEELAASTLGYTEFTYTGRKANGSIHSTDELVGMSPSADIANIVPKYGWKYEMQSGLGFLRARPLHNRVTFGPEQTVVEGDILRVTRDAAGNVTYQVNGSTVYSGAGTDTVAMKTKVGLPAVSGRALGLRMDIGAGSISPTWENKVNIQEF